MDVQRLAIAGAFVVTPRVFPDDRGAFHEWFKGDALAAAGAPPFELAQANLSVSRPGVIRGIHYADVPPGQAKYLTCVAGSVLDVVVDLRVGSPTFGQWDAVLLDADKPTAVFLAEGLGHGFMALDEGATVTYLCSTGFNPAAEHAIDPFDTQLAITWPDHLPPVTSAKDAQAPSLDAVLVAGGLPQFDACQQWYARGERRG